MDQPTSDGILAELFLDYDRRRARGETPRAEEFRGRAGEHYAEFLEILGATTLLEGPEGTPPGEQLPREFGDYTLLDVLGSGGMGIVYRARQRTLGRIVALKRLRVGGVGESRLVRRFRRGARAAARIEHDHAIRIHDFGLVDGEPFLAMNLLAGPTLREVLRNLVRVGEEPFGPRHHAVLDRSGVPGQGADIADYVRRIAALLAGPVRALDRYHEAGIVHRDLKPSNLMLDGSGRLVLADFDLVRWPGESAVTMTRNPLGTPAYMSPEQWMVRTANLDGRADLYSMGAVFYEAVTLRRPFEDDRADVLMARTLTVRPPDPAHHVPDLPAAARRVALSCLEKRPSDRPAGAAALATDLEALALERPVKARPVSSLRRTTRTVARYRRLLLAASLLALAAAAGWWLRPRRVEIEVITDPLVGEIFLARVDRDGSAGEEVRLGPAPVTNHRVWAGRYRIRTRAEHFRDHVVEIAADPDVPSPIRVTAVLRFRSTSAGREYFARRFAAPEEMPYVLDPSGNGMELLAGPSVGTAGRPPGQIAPDTVRVLFPRGPVLEGDLGTCALETERRVSGRLLFLDANGAVLHEERVDVDPTGAPRALPADLLARLEPGRRYRWGVEVAGRVPTLAEFEVLPGSTSEILAEIDRATPRGEEELGRLVGLAVLRDRGLNFAAWRRSRELAETWPVREVIAAGLRSLDDLGLTGSRAWRELRARLEGAPGWR